MSISRDKRTIKRDAQYAAALDYLDVRLAEGKLSPSEHEIRRTRMLAEAVKTPWPASVQLLVGFATIIVVLIIIVVALSIGGAFVSSVGS